MAYTAQEVISSALTLLEDAEQNRFTDAMLLEFINEGMVDIVKVKPTANVVYSVKALAAGAPQTLANNQLYLLDAVYNTDTTGTAQGQSPIRVNKATLDFSNPDWTSAARREEVMYFTYDSDGTRVFYVYPPNTGYGHLYIKTTDIPTSLTSKTQTVPMRDEYKQALVYYTCMKGYMVDTDTINTDKVSMYRTLYTESINSIKLADAREETKNAG